MMQTADTNPGHLDLSWLAFDSIIVARTAALYRNLADSVFPGRASSDELKAAREKIADACKRLKPAGAAGAGAGAGGMESLAVGDAMWVNVMSARERLLGGGASKNDRNEIAFFFSDGPVELIVNDEDHLEFFMNCAEDTFRSAARELGAFADMLGRRLRFASSETFGWLAANPEHAGLGMRVQQCFCLCGLALTREIDAVLRGIERIGFEVAPMYDDGAAADGGAADGAQPPEFAPGNCYWISPIATPGMDCGALLDKAERVFKEIAKIEQNARFALLDDPVLNTSLEDYAMRAAGAGAGAQMATEAECVDLRAALEFALDMGVFAGGKRAEERDMLYNELRKLVAILGLYEEVLQKDIAAGGALSEDELETSKKRFFANCIKQDFLDVLPEWLDKVSAPPEGLGGAKKSKNTKKRRK